MNSSEKNAPKRELQEALGRAVRHLRERRRDRASQEALADAVGMDRSYWGDLERGERSPTLYNLWRIAQALGVTPSRLVLAIDNQRGRVRSAPAGPLGGEIKVLRKFMDQLPTMKWFADRKHNCLHCNPPLLEYLGCGLEQVTGQQWRKLVYPADQDKQAAESHKSFARRKPYITKYRIRRADGKYALVIQQATPQFTPKGAFLGFLGAIIPEPED